MMSGGVSILVKAWNFSTWPAYKSRFWNKEEGAREEQVQGRKPYVILLSSFYPVQSLSTGMTDSRKQILALRLLSFRNPEVDMSSAGN